MGNKGGGFFPPRWLARVRKIAYIYTAHVVAAAASGVDAWRVLALVLASLPGSTTGVTGVVLRSAAAARGCVLHGERRFTRF